MCKHCGHPIGYHWLEGEKCASWTASVRGQDERTDLALFGIVIPRDWADPASHRLQELGVCLANQAGPSDVGRR